ncbi:hypothetical protein [Microbacterium sp. P04]|uniref:hypothetical protein n=1 Tax=Microbacterium sp. P04 TaxID=3366947 RepID=UPI00374560C9
MFDDSHATEYVITSRSRGKTLHFKGKCPFCSGDVDFAVNLQLVPVDQDALVAQGGGEVIVDIECTCTEPHAGRPAGRNGCGQTWSVTVEVAV